MSSQAGRYELMDEIGVGGVGAVHRARDRASGHVLFLSSKHGGQIVVVGGAILALDSACELAIDADLLEPIASALHERTAATTATRALGRGT